MQHGLFGRTDKPSQVASILEQCHELHIRWAALDDHSIPAPFASRLPSGLHIFFTPLKAGEEVNLCPLIHQLFGSELKCDSTTESFTRPSQLSETFSSSASYQYYHVLPSLENFNRYLQANACRTDLKTRIACENEAEFATYAASVDIDFDAISHTVDLSALWSADKDALFQRPGSGITDRAVVKYRENHRVEVGVLQNEPVKEVEELSLGGYLAVLGEHEKPSMLSPLITIYESFKTADNLLQSTGATMFSFPSRHHPLPAPTSQKLSFAATFQQPTGLHPKLDLTFPANSLTPPQPSCALHAYLTLPSALFIDRYQFSDPLSLSSQSLIALRALSGSQDLEAPDWVIPAWGSAALFELAHPKVPTDADETSTWTATIPTHLRYVKPSNASSSSESQSTLSIPAPVVFWACNADEGAKFNVNPFDRVNLGYDGLFGTKTMFYHVPPAPAMAEVGSGHGLMLDLNVPVLDSKFAGWVPMATLAVVLAGFGWVVLKLVGGGGAKKEAEAKKKQ